MEGIYYLQTNRYNLILQMLSKICCFNTDISKCVCLGLTRNKVIKIGYSLILVLAFVALLLINAGVENYSDQTIEAYHCQDDTDEQIVQLSSFECVRNKNAVIVYTGVAFLHFFLLCSMFCKSEKVKMINQGLWIIKILVAALISLFLRFMVGTTFFLYIEYLSVWTANVFYLFIAIVFVDLTYAFDAYLDECAQENGKIYILKAIISITLLLTSSFICFLSFKHNDIVVCWVNAVSLLVLLIFALLRLFPGNSILVSGLIGLCINIIGFYIESEDNQEEAWGSSLIGIKILFVVFLLMGMLCQGSNKLRTKKSTFNELLALNTNATQEDNRYVSSNKWTVYHYIMIIIAISIPAVIGWQSEGNTEQVNGWLEYNNMTWWIATIVLYLWSLACSKLFPQKDFSDLQNYFREYELQ